MDEKDLECIVEELQYKIECLDKLCLENALVSSYCSKGCMNCWVLDRKNVLKGRLEEVKKYEYSRNL
jgi:hypothetical protein